MLRPPPRRARQLRARGGRVGRDRDVAVERRRVPDLGPPAGRPAQPPPGAGADLVGADRRGGGGDCARWRAPCGWSRRGGRSAPPPCSSPSRRWRGRCSPMSTRRRWRSAGGSPCGRVCCTAVLVRVSSAAWLTAFGWAALALPRRDGLIWACVALVVALGHGGRTAAEWWRSLGVGPRIVVAASTVDHRGMGRHQRLESLPVRRRRPADRRRRRGGALDVAGAGDDRAARLVMLAAWRRSAAPPSAVVLTRRPGGWDSDLATRIVGETGYNFIEAIGRLGWLDVPLAGGLDRPHLRGDRSARRGVVGGGLGSGELGGRAARQHRRSIVAVRAVSGQHDGDVLAGPLLAAVARRRPAAARPRPRPRRGCLRGWPGASAAAPSSCSTWRRGPRRGAGASASTDR